MTLVEIIRNECLPARDCMLTVQDSDGEAAFFYFKDAELIEANFASMWGKDALAQVMTWNIVEHTITALPLGIKRSLWDSLDILLVPPETITPEITKSSSILPSFSDAKVIKEVTPFDQFKQVPGVTSLFFIENGQHRVVYQVSKEVENTTWVNEFLQTSKALGDTLGFGKLKQLVLTTDRYHIIGFRFQAGILGVVRKDDVGLDDFEADCRACYEESSKGDIQ